MAFRGEDFMNPSTGGSVYKVSVPPSLDLLESEPSQPNTSIAPLSFLQPQIQITQGQDGSVPEDGEVEAIEGVEGGLGKGSLSKSGKPQVTVRIRPTQQLSNGIFEVDVETKTIQIRVERETKLQGPKLKPPSSFIYFPADHVLENSSQEETFNSVALEIVERAMQGVPGMIIAVGPEFSGKTYSLFGLSGTYGNRGITARVFEKMFEIKERLHEEVEFKFGMGIVEVRRERIKDLLTLGPYEINDVGDRGPKAMYVEEVDNLEHGIGLLLRALIGQKMIHQEPFERFHTIVYFEIVASSKTEPALVLYRSKITFAEIAAAPCTKSEVTPTQNTCPSTHFSICNISQLPCRQESRFKLKQSVFPTRKCTNPGYSSGPLAESIAVRRDVFALEQMFLKASEMQRVKAYFSKLETLGLSMLASEKKKHAGGQNVRQNKLAHCLKDILDGGTEIRILLHVRPDKICLKSSLEAMRFAERARLVPSNIDGEISKGKQDRTEDQILQEVINDIAPELTQPANVETLTSEKMRLIQEQAVHYFENNIDSMKVCSKEKVKHMFENFRVLWNFLWELELNVSLRKAEEDMRAAMHHAGANVTWSGGAGQNGVLFPPNDEDDEPKHELQPKKSGRKQKKDKQKKKRDKLSKRESNDPRAEANKDGDNNSAKDGVEGEPSRPPSEGKDEITGSKPEGEGKRQSLSDPTGIMPPSGDTPQQTSISPPVEGQDPALPVPRPPEPVAATELTDSSKRAESASGKILPLEPHTDNPPKTSTIDPDHLAHLTATLRTSTFHREEVKPSPISEERKDEVDEEVIAHAAKVEQQMSENFEEIKKIARRQALHLIRSGVQKPQWVKLF